MLSTITLAALLLGTWIVWSGYLSSFFVISGLCATAIAVYAAYRMNILEKKEGPTPLYLNRKSIPYYVWLIKEIILSSLDTAKLIWQIKPTISPTVACIPATQKTDAGKALFANSITLTPGTVSMMAEEDQILVHALRKEGIEDLLTGDMDKRVSHVTNNIIK